MFDNNWKTWVVLVIAFVGASFELLKHLPSGQNVSWEKENLHYGVDGKPYSVRQLPKKLRAPVRPVTAHVGGDAKVLADALTSYNSANAPTTTEIEHKEAPAKAAAAKKKINEDDYEIVIDPKTGKKVKRKKKKEAKKEEPKAKAVVSTKPETPADDADEATDPDAIAAAIAAIAKSGELPLPIKKNTKDPFASLQEWERVLLARPSLAETKVFIQAFRSHTVTSDIYYKITKLMLADSRPEMKSLGVLCAGSNPSVLSFQILAGVVTTGSSDLKTNAQKFLNAYSDSLSDLATLQGVLRAGDNVASTVALKQLDAAATRFLTSTATPSPATQNNQPAAAAQFQPFRAILTQLAASSDSGLAAQAQHSLTSLDALLGSSPNSALASTP